MDLGLNVSQRCCLVGQLGRLDKILINLGEIHDREVEPGELVDGEPRTIGRLHRPPGLAQLGAALLLQDPRELGRKNAIGLRLGGADDEGLGTIGADVVRQTLVDLPGQKRISRAAGADQRESVGRSKPSSRLGEADGDCDSGMVIGDGQLCMMQTSNGSRERKTQP